MSETNKYIDGVVVESVASSYSFSEKKYGLKERKQFENQINKIKELKLKFKKPFLLVEYADTKILRDKIVQRLTKYKLDYFIGKLDLQSIPDYTK